MAGLPIIGESSRLPFWICTAQVVGITSPTIYSSLTWACSHILLPPLLNHAPEPILAKQWLEAYQSASYFVPPLIFSGTIANAYLAYTYMSSAIGTKSIGSSWWISYVGAAVATASIMPWTLFGFEPYINGAAKWKVSKVLGDDPGWKPMEEQKGSMPSPWVHTGKEEARRWAEERPLEEIVAEWGRRNNWRYRVGSLATFLSMVGTIVSLTDSMPFKRR